MQHGLDDFRRLGLRGEGCSHKGTRIKEMHSLQFSVGYVACWHLTDIGLLTMSALRHKRPFTKGPYFYGQTIKDKRPRGHYTAWPLRDQPSRHPSSAQNGVRAKRRQQYHRAFKKPAAIAA